MKKHVRINEEVIKEEVIREEDEDKQQQYQPEEGKQHYQYEEDSSSLNSDDEEEKETNKYKKYFTEQNCKNRHKRGSNILENEDDLVKIKTQKEIYYEDKDKLAASKSYIYLAKGLSDELSDDQASYNGH